MIFSQNAFSAVAPDMRISDNDGDVLVVNSDSTLTLSTISTSGTGTALGSIDKRICDDQGDCLGVNPDGSFNATVGAPNN